MSMKSKAYVVIQNASPWADLRVGSSGFKCSGVYRYGGDQNNEEGEEFERHGCRKEMET